MKFGLTENEYQFILSTVISPLKTKGATVWCFGSRARGDQQKFSDIDLMIQSNTDLSREINYITETIIESNFPYKVDIVQLKDFAESYKINFEKEKIKF